MLSFLLYKKGYVVFLLDNHTKMSLICCFQNYDVEIKKIYLGLYLKKVG